MKPNLFIIFALLITECAPGQIRMVRGKVTSNGNPLEFATIAIARYSIGTSSAKNGTFMLDSIPGRDSLDMIVSQVGYKSQHFKIGPDAYTEVIATLEKEVSSLAEVVVTGVSKATLIRENPVAVEIISAKQIDQSTESNVIDAISKNAPGLQTVKTGPNVSKPFINGLGYNRVLTLYDGMRVETQQWGDEHGVPMDDYAIQKAEVIKGPSSLMYGSDAIAGVLSLFPAIPLDTDKVIHGKFITEYQTNNGLIGNSLFLSTGGAHWSWAVRGSGRIAKNYSDPIDGQVYNTGFKSANGCAFGGYSNDKGYSHLNVTFYDNRQAIPDGSRDSLTRKFTYQVYESPGENILLPMVDNIKSRPVVPESVLNSYTLGPLVQRIQDYRIYTDHAYQLGAGDIKASLGVEQNIRREYDHPTDADQAGEYIVLNTLDYGLRYTAPALFNIEPTVGVNGMYQVNTNENATDFPIPDYRLFDVGTFGYAKWKWNRWTIAGGIRYDQRNEWGYEMYTKPNPVTGFYSQVPASDSVGSQKQFPAFHLMFQGISGSAGATYRLDDHLSIKSNIARGYRAPNITEIASSGLDPGAHIYYEGNLDFKPEFSLQEDMGIIGAYPVFSFSFSAFNNYIQNYIYEDQAVDHSGNPVVIVPGNKTFQFQQTNARLSGLDASFIFRPANCKRLNLESYVSVVYGNNLNPKFSDAGVNGHYLPFIPPPRWLSSARFAIPVRCAALQDIVVNAEADCNAAQNRYLGLYNTETATPAYTLLNLSAHMDVRYSKKQLLQFQFAVNNALNTAYQSHLSRLQYFEYYNVSPNGHYGIYNMGRNLCGKVILPF